MNRFSRTVFAFLFAHSVGSYAAWLAAILAALFTSPSYTPGNWGTLAVLVLLAPITIPLLLLDSWQYPTVQMVIPGMTYLILTVAIFRFRRKRNLIYWRKSQGLCLHCGYSLRGNVTGVCPECGSSVVSIQAFNGCWRDNERHK